MFPVENSYESGERKVIPAVLIYLRQDDRVLMIHRNSRSPGKVDYHEGKWNGLGGKCEKDESPLEAAQREVLEESGLALLPDQLKSLGVLQFPNFKADRNEDWMVFVFYGTLAKEDSRESKSQSEEGALHWVPVKDLLLLNLWPGDRLFIPYVMKSQPFIGTIWYRDQKVVKEWIQPITS